MMRIHRNKTDACWQSEMPAAYRCKSETRSQLVAAENADRQKLYQAIANANGHPMVAQIKATLPPVGSVMPSQAGGINPLMAVGQKNKHGRQDQEKAAPETPVKVL